MQGLARGAIGGRARLTSFGQRCSRSAKHFEQSSLIRLENSDLQRGRSVCAKAATRACNRSFRSRNGTEPQIMNAGTSFGAGAKGVDRVDLPVVLVFMLAGCQATLTPTPIPNPITGQNPSDVKYYHSDEPVRLGIQRFYEGNFGLSQQYFQDAVEKAPKDVTAWIGLAASYDRLGRFDLADRSYASAVKLAGNTPNIVNNEGYSYMLRCDLKTPRVKFETPFSSA